MNVLLFALVGLAVGAASMRKMPLPRLAAWAAGLAGAILGGFLLSALGPVFRGPVGGILAAMAGALLALLLARPFYANPRPEA